MTTSTLQIVIGGEAGQGLVTLGDLLARSLVRSGYHVQVTQTYMSRIRGGHNTFAIRVGIDPIGAPHDPINILVALDGATVELHREALVPNESVVIVDDLVSVDVEPCVRVPFKKLAGARYENIVALGAVSALLGLNKSIVGDAVVAAFGTKAEAVSMANSEALEVAYTWAATVPAFPVRLSPANTIATPRLLISGNEAIALGALAGGVKFCAFYPMSPATSVVLNLAKYADDMGLVVEQAEDEIAAVNMTLGASFSGCRSLTATSGGGFALMTEGVSLAGMTETPLVIIVAQRPGPATGLPTRTEQGDLEFVLHSGHGEFPRAIFAPGSIDGCFELMRGTFALAEASRGPVFLLTDQFLADSYRDVEPFKLDGLNGMSPPSSEVVSGPYRPYAITDSGVSPRLVPGAGTDCVLADSDEHDEAGHITEDLQLRIKMVDKRLRKWKILTDRVMPPDYEGDESPELLLIDWGSTRGAVSETVGRLRATGNKVGALHFQQVWPLVPDQFIERLQKAGRVVCVEGNATGQFSHLIRRETGFNVHQLILRYDGLPFTSDFILGELQHE